MRPSFSFEHLHSHESSRPDPACNLRDLSAENPVHLSLGEGWQTKMHWIGIVLEVSGWWRFAALEEGKKQGEWAWEGVIGACRKHHHWGYPHEYHQS